MWRKQVPFVPPNSQWWFPLFSPKQLLPLTIPLLSLLFYCGMLSLLGACVRFLLKWIFLSKPAHPPVPVIRWGRICRAPVGRWALSHGAPAQDGSSTRTHSHTRIPPQPGRFSGSAGTLPRPPRPRSTAFEMARARPGACAPKPRTNSPAQNGETSFFTSDFLRIAVYGGN